MDNSIQWWTLWLTAASTLLWGIYVFFTIRTFLQIREQTILQSRAFLVVKPQQQDVPVDIAKYNQDALNKHNLWKGILERNLPDALRQEGCFILKLINRGKSDIISWRIDINVDIIAGSFLQGRNIYGEVFHFSTINPNNEQIAPDEDFVVHVLPYGYFPQARITWNIEYRDFRNNIDRVNGTITISNSIALDYNQPPIDNVGV